jgi:hypothetical protein
MGAGFPGFPAIARLGGYQQRCCADRVLQRAADDLGRTDHASIVEALEFLAARVEAEIVLALHQCSTRPCSDQRDFHFLVPCNAERRNKKGGRFQQSPFL